ncbi:MAG: hypothetical protein ACO1OQ_12130 [Rufibacter sp.]
MRHQAIEFREERDLGEKLNVTFGFIREHYKILLTSTLYFVLPFALLAGVASGLYQNDQLSLLAEASQGVGSGSYFGSLFMSLYYWLQLFFMIVSMVMMSLAVYTYMVHYMDYGQPAEISDIWAGIRHHFIPVLYSSIGLSFLVGIASLFLLVPGLYIGVACSVFVIVMVREEVGFVDALERCFYLVKGNWWASFGFLIIVFIIQWVISFLASVPAIVIYVMNILKLPGAENSLLLVSATAFSTIISLLLYSIIITAIAFHYFSLVEIKDGIGLLEQVEKIGQREPQTALQED